MSCSCCSTDPSNVDPALPADPFVRNHYHYGQLLGADDFTLEQRAHRVRHRLHQALLHGFGTVCGLRVSSREDEGSERLLVAPGWAVDLFGRDLYVDAEQCLDVTRLVHDATWSELEPTPAAEVAAEGDGDGGGDEADDGDGDGGDDDGGDDDVEVVEVEAGGGDDAPSGEGRRAYVVLRYASCLAEPVPAIRPPCTPEEHAQEHSRIRDAFRVDLVAEAPPDPHELARSWLGAGADADPRPASLRAAWLESVLSCSAEDLARRWRQHEDVPVLLAVVDLEAVGEGDDARTRIVAVDNAPRPLLPPVQVVAEHVLGERLTGAPADAAPFTLLGVGLEAPPAGHVVTLRLAFSTQPDERSAAGAVRLLRLDANGWVDATAKVDVTVAENTLVLDLRDEGGEAAAWTDGLPYQVIVAGADAAPLVDVAGRPLAGWADEPRGLAGRGRDVSHVGTYTTPEEQP